DILASSDNLSRFVVDATSGGSVHRSDGLGPSYYMMPNLKIVNYNSQRGLTQKPLPGWKEIRTRIKTAAKSGIVILFGGYRGEMTADGHYFAFELVFKRHSAYRSDGISQS